MDTDELRSILSRSRVGVFELIHTAIQVAGSDDGAELLRRRDQIIESLYTVAPQVCRNCNDVVPGSHIGSRNMNKISVDDEEEDYSKRKNEYTGNNNNNKEDYVSKSPLTPESNHRSGSDDDADPFGALFDEDDQTKILSIREQLEDPDQSEDDVVELLQKLADMDINFQDLQETDIGRHVNRLRKHSSNEVRRLVKQLVRKWKETVDDWVKVNNPQGTSNLIADGDSPQQNIPKNQQNGHHQVPDFENSPNPHNGNSSAERNYMDHETKHKPMQPAPRREPPSRPQQSVVKTSSAPPNRTARAAPTLDDERLNSARKRLQENYQEAQNAKKQRKIQVMDFKELPKPKNGFFSRNRGGFHGRR